MTKEAIEDIFKGFEKNLNERERLLCEIQKEENIVNSLSQNPDVVEYLNLQSHLEDLYEDLYENLYFTTDTDDILDYALNGTYSNVGDEPFMWYCDYYFPINNGKVESFSINVCREDEKGTYRVYLGVESLKLLDLTREEAFLFEQVNDIIVLDEYNNSKKRGLSLNTIYKYRKGYFLDILNSVNQKIKTK